MSNSKNVDADYYADKLKEIITDFDKFAIIAALETYESLTLSKLSLLLHKPRTTLLGHIKILLKDKLIEIDSKTSGERWGKFYRIINNFQQEFTKHRPSLYEGFTGLQDEIIENITETQIKKIMLNRKNFREESGLSIQRLIQYCGFAYFIQKFIINNIEEREKKEQDLIFFSESDFMQAYFELFSRGFPVSKPIHVMKYASLIKKFLADFLKMTQEICKEIEQEDVADENIQRYYLHVFGGSLKT